MCTKARSGGVLGKCMRFCQAQNTVHTTERTARKPRNSNRRESPRASPDPPGLPPRLLQWPRRRRRNHSSPRPTAADASPSPRWSSKEQPISSGRNGNVKWKPHCRIMICRRAKGKKNQFSKSVVFCCHVALSREAVSF